MRANRQSSLRERVQKTSQAFQFDALLGQGQEQDAGDPQSMLDAAAAAGMALEVETPVEGAPAAAAEPGLGAGGLFDLVDLEPVEDAVPVRTPDPPVQGHMSPVAVPTAQAEPRPAPANRDMLYDALDGLGLQLLAEAGRMRAALAGGEVAEAGFCLAHLNKVIELLQSMDPDGDVARRLGTTAAPPPGRSWPRTAWSVAEFAESPLSGLLPASSDLMLVADLLECAWEVAGGQ